MLFPKAFTALARPFSNTLAKIVRVRVAHRISSNVDVLLLAELNELRLDESRMALNLIRSRSDARRVDESLQMLLAMVRNTNSSRLGLVKSSHGFPGVDNRDAVEHLDVVALHGEEVVVGLVRLVEGYGEMHEIKIEILQTKLCEAVIQSWLHVLGTVLRVPQFGGDEDIFALQTFNAAVECFLKRLCNFLLVAVAVERTAVSLCSLLA